ncbi:MAG: hypothetical protein JOY97_12495 [Hyphomicrobiales bacterium]|nr:hypothetical protein [Hyphomicrobiales bacterium]
MAVSITCGFQDVLYELLGIYAATYVIGTGVRLLGAQFNAELAQATQRCG